MPSHHSLVFLRYFFFLIHLLPLLIGVGGNELIRDYIPLAFSDPVTAAA